MSSPSPVLATRLRRPSWRDARLLVGVLLGQWIDKRYGTGYVWTVSLMAFGLCMGCFNAWRSITKET